MRFTKPDHNDYSTKPPRSTRTEPLGATCSNPRTNFVKQEVIPSETKHKEWRCLSLKLRNFLKDSRLMEELQVCLSNTVVRNQGNQRLESSQTDKKLARVI